MPMIRIMPILSLIVLASCAGNPGGNAGIAGPTGRAADAGSIREIGVRETWKFDLKPQSQTIISGKIEDGKTAKFDPIVRYDGYYDANRGVTRVGVYGNVTTNTDYGTVHDNGYYVIWEETGRIASDFPPPWRLVDVEITDQLY